MNRLARMIALCVPCLLLAARADGQLHPQPDLLRIDFEQSFHVHPGMQVWDLCLVEDGGIYNLFYHAIPETTPTAAYADHIWRTTSDDLVRWSEPQIVLSVSSLPHESLAVWAPSVIRDETTGVWWMAYTGVDAYYTQRICLAYSRDLVNWNKHDGNPVVEPDATVFHYPATEGGECRDPFLYRSEDGPWNMLVSAKVLGMPSGQGVIARATSPNLVDWSPLEVFLINDGPYPTRTLESVQYHVIDGVHHIFFHEFYNNGVSHLAAADPADWTFANRTYLDPGIAPEITTFDDGQNWLLTRITAFQNPGSDLVSWVARTDTLVFQEQTIAAPALFKPHPLKRYFATYSGTATLGNPCFGDNPARRGEQPAALVGNSYFGSKEYYQGPLSGRGEPGLQLGPIAQGSLQTDPFTIRGNSITMLVGGTDNPEHCYVALFDAEADTVLRRATGHGAETMTPRVWDVRDLDGRNVYLRIVDSDPEGYINVDEIHEVLDIFTAVDDRPAMPSPLLIDHGPRPNPFNPATVLRFELAAAAPCRVRIHDLRGRLVWDSRSFAGRPGPNAVTWHGEDLAGRPVPGGVYAYRIEAGRTTAASGKLTLLP